VKKNKKENLNNETSSPKNIAKSGAPSFYLTD
jgi:hypothetical protein